jgi:hypothetical protein
VNSPLTDATHLAQYEVGVLRVEKDTHVFGGYANDANIQNLKIHDKLTSITIGHSDVINSFTWKTKNGRTDTYGN